MDRLDEARRRLHEEIAEGFLASGGSKPGPPTAVFVIGPPGAGKTRIGVPLVEKSFERSFTTVNADDIKEALPEYAGWNAAALHEESAYIAESLVRQRAVARRRNLLLDLTGRDGLKLEAEAKALKQMRYEVYLLLVHVPAWRSALGVWQRFQINPFGRCDANAPPSRFVPPVYAARSIADRPLRTFRSLKGSRLLDGFCRIDPDAAHGPASTVPVDSDRWPSP